eukprot:7931725-Pyramimonas_sp.AAC.1
MQSNREVKLFTWAARSHLTGRPDQSSIAEVELRGNNLINYAASGPTLEFLALESLRFSALALSVSFCATCARCGCLRGDPEDRWVTEQVLGNNHEYTVPYYSHLPSASILQQAGAQRMSSILLERQL